MAQINQTTIMKMRKLLASWTVFYQKTHTYHWDYSGDEFLSFHKHLEELYDESVKHTDSIAERLRQLGEKILLSLGSASRDSVVGDDNSAKTLPDTIADLITGLIQITTLQTEIYKEADEQGDYVTADLMTQLSKWAEFNSWFLTSMTQAKE